MEWDLRVKKELSFSWLEIQGGFLGEDYFLCVQGGDRPHIGCTVQAVPRPSLTGDGSKGATSSVLNLTGHKDEAICRMLAEEFCKRLGVVVVCTGGFHVDGITGEQITEVMTAAEELWSTQGSMPPKGICSQRGYAAKAACGPRRERGKGFPYLIDERYGAVR